MLTERMRDRNTVKIRDFERESLKERERVRQRETVELTCVKEKERETHTERKKGTL